MTSRIGIYAGTFDPVHSGHITFALQAMEHAGLDAIYFLPERKPRQKQGVEHFGHRVAMLKRACKPHPKFSVLELDDVSFTIRRTLPVLQKEFQDSQLVFLFGSDAIAQLPNWNFSDKLLQKCELVVGVRSTETMQDVINAVGQWETAPKHLYAFNSYAPEIAASEIRKALRTNQNTKGALSSVKQYSNQNWLYVSVS